MCIFRPDLVIVQAILLLIAFSCVSAGGYSTTDDSLSNSITRDALRHDWNGGILFSSLAIQIRDHLQNCSNDEIVFHHIRGYGIGSDLHTWSQALCNSMEKNKVLLLRREPWIWHDSRRCINSNTINPLHCFFQYKNNACLSSKKQSHIEEVNNIVIPPYKDAFKIDSRFETFDNGFGNCPKYIRDLQTRHSFRAAAMELLFSTVSPLIIDDANKAALTLWPGGTPADLITVHIRWGDKRSEMRLPSIEAIVSATLSLVHKHKLNTPHIYLSTDDENAKSQFKSGLKEALADCSIYHYEQQTPDEELKHGIQGQTSIVSLLLALEADHYVFATASSWSRLINELRLNVIDKLCKNCTDYVDIGANNNKPQYDNW